MDTAAAENRTALVVESDRKDRELVASLLERLGCRLLQADSGEQGLALAGDEALSLAVVEVELPGMSGYELCRELQDTFGHDLAVVFVSRARREPIDSVAGLLIGADEYIVKPFHPDEFVVRVRRLLERGASPNSSATVGEGAGLTRREAEVLGLLADGLTQAQIAVQLTISATTVATHIQRILAKLGVHSRTQAVALAVRGGAPRDVS